jgi:hypothetical protein
VVRTWQATGTITGAGTGSGWTVADGPTSGEAGPVLYTGPMNATYESTVPTDVEAVGQVTSESVVTVAIPSTAPDIPTDGAYVTVTAVSGNADPTLVGRSLLVRKSAHQAGSLERILTCTDDQGTPPTGEG